MPTYNEFNELISNTTSSWVTINGTDGEKFTSKTNPNAYVFFPAAGRYFEGSPYTKGTRGYYWTSTPQNSDNSYYLTFTSGFKDVYHSYRFNGFSVRGVHAAV